MGFRALLSESLFQKQFRRFLAAGALAAAANFGSRFLFSLWVRYEWAVVLAYLVGMITAFLLMRGYVFNARGRPAGRQVVIFAAVNLAALLQTLLVSTTLVRWVLPSIGVATHTEAIAHLAGILVPVATSFVGHRLLTFK